MTYHFPSRFFFSFYLFIYFLSLPFALSKQTIIKRKMINDFYKTEDNNNLNIHKNLNFFFYLNFFYIKIFFSHDNDK